MLPPDLLIAFAVGLVTGGFMAGIWSSLVRPPETSSRVVGFPSSPRPPAPNVPRLPASRKSLTLRLLKAIERQEGRTDAKP